MYIYSRIIVIRNTQVIHNHIRYLIYIHFLFTSEELIPSVNRIVKLILIILYMNT